MKCSISLLLTAILLLGCTGCADSSQPGSSSAAENEVSAPVPQTVDAMQFSASGITLTPERFLFAYSELALTAPDGAEIYYTLDGSMPTKESARYAAPVLMPEQAAENFPGCLVLRAKAYFADGTESDTATQTFWYMPDADARFRNLVISVTGDPAEITEKPDGILYGENAKLRGREYERAVSVEAVNPDGTLIFAQNAGMRAYGAASREAALKSMKLYARKSYDPAHGKFAYDGFGTIGADGGIITKYDKLVLRNGGNDFQFAFIRDELHQRLAADAGYTDCEAVKPVIVYLNGAYYGLFWLHETLCDDLLKALYGGDTGEYVILEGKEQEKYSDADAASYADDFNSTYEALTLQDLTDDDAYAAVCDFLDVENYLQYYAFNIYINNKDWPQNNMKCYRYIAGADEAYGTDSPADGRWRFWFHDMDYSEGLYEQDETQADYNNLAEILEPENERYAPLFAKMMKREDCRSYFLDEIHRLTADILSAEHAEEVLDSMNAERYIEMRRYFDSLEARKKTNSDIWIWYEGYIEQTGQIRTFMENRAAYMEDFLAEAFPDEPNVPDVS